jgi:hypothetical protein
MRRRQSSCAHTSGDPTAPASQHPLPPSGRKSTSRSSPPGMAAGAHQSHRRRDGGGGTPRSSPPGMAAGAYQSHRRRDGGGGTLRSSPPGMAAGTSNFIAAGKAAERGSQQGSAQLTDPPWTPRLTPADVSCHEAAYPHSPLRDTSSL